MFSTSSCGFATCFRHAFDFFSLKPSREPAASISTCRDWSRCKLMQRLMQHDAAGSLVRARARQMKCRKNPFRASRRTCWSWIFVTYFIIRAYHDVVKWKKRYAKAWFYTQNRYKLCPSIINPRYGTQNSPTSILKLLHVSTHIIGFHFWKHSAICIISVSVSDILFNPCGVFPFLHGR